jgi:hypothetical protein
MPGEGQGSPDEAAGLSVELRGLRRELAALDVERERLATEYGRAFTVWNALADQAQRLRTKIAAAEAALLAEI